ncbi:MAG TPA: nicotinate (nicotinamide) nucleotide adenylyltransferase [Thermoanaerobaculia bacterium]|nr:nicotinate (nicotinamide) nucleotide adenylyltransferase [Thermoanaerobaculia bacterium]
MRIGVLGGTFDPVHFGHLRTVEAAAARFDLGTVLYVPARRSPFKDESPADPRHRVAMLALALNGHPDWRIVFDDLDREPPSYTVDTLRALTARSGGAELWLLMGTDTLAHLARWREPEEIVRLARIAAFHREPFVGGGLRVPEIQGLSNRLEVFDAGSVKISASGLRASLRRGETAADSVPGPVAEYITKHGLYRSQAAAR